MDKWRVSRLGDVCSYEKEQDIHSGLPYVGLENIESSTGRFLGSTNAVSVKSTTFHFTPEHVLYGRLRPYLNKVLLPYFEGHCSTEVFPIRPSPAISREFLFHWLSMDATMKLIDATCTGARMPRANMNAVLDFELPVPPLPEQRRIVAVLNEAFEAISTAKANTEKSLQNAREVFSSALAELFPSNTESVSLAELSVSISDGDHSPPPKAASGVPFITISNVDKETREIDFTSTFTVPREYFDNLKSQRRPQPGDVLYTVTGSFGIPILVEGDREFCFQRHIGLIRPKSNVDSRWLMYGLLSPMSFAQADAGATGTAQRTVSLGVLRGLRLPRVSSEAQCLDADRLDALDTDVSRLKGIAKAKIAALAELKKSLLHQAFTGQL
jgi:type I restriction enzyme S subunit